MAFLVFGMVLANRKVMVKCNGKEVGDWPRSSAVRELVIKSLSLGRRKESV